MIVQPYLSFEGRCEEAVEFYRTALDAEVIMMLRFKDSPESAMVTPDAMDKVMHATLRIGDSTILASDGRCGGAASFQGISLSLTVKDEAEGTSRFAALAEGGQVHMPLAKTFFSPGFGMVSDRFGVSWMVMVEPAA